MTDRVTHPTEDLSLLALGLLEESERRSIERHLVTCSGCRAELATHEETVAALAGGIGRDAPRELRDRVVAAHARTPWRRLAVPGFATALVLLVAMAGLLVKAQLDLQQERAQRDEYVATLSAVAQGARVVALSGTRADAHASLVVPTQGQAYLVLRVPDPPAGMAYEAWVIRDGTPHAAGISAARGGVMTMALEMDIRAGDVAAVTIEPLRGVDRPTSDPLLAGGL